MDDNQERAVIHVSRWMKLQNRQQEAAQACTEALASDRDEEAERQAERYHRIGELIEKNRELIKHCQNARPQQHK